MKPSLRCMPAGGGAAETHLQTHALHHLSLWSVKVMEIQTLA